jgi:drug/metabolite transporter (DMT)-like permease
MQSLVIGIIAALGWGVHDVCVRFVSQRVGINLAYLVVLVSGLMLVAPLALVFGDWQAVSPAVIACAAAAGAIYAGAGYCLYRAFAIGPVRLVAPVIGAYPILSLAWAAAQGNVPLPGQIIAALMVVAGVGAGALLTDEEPGDAPGSIRQALIWALLSMVAFALSFALGQLASQMGDDWPTMAISRAAALLVLLTVTLASRPLPRLTGVPWALLCFMGLCDAMALGLVIAAGRLPHPEFAAVSASTFGVVTILLAWAFLKEPINALQWGAVALVFGGIGYLAL